MKKAIYSMSFKGYFARVGLFSGDATAFRKSIISDQQWVLKQEKRNNS